MVLRIRISAAAINLLAIIAMAIAMLVTGPSMMSAQAASHDFCRAYAQTAQKQFMQMQKYKKCQVPVSGRWQPKLKPHYDWCRTVSTAAPNAETKIRTAHLVQCGATVEMAEPGMNPVE